MLRIYTSLLLLLLTDIPNCNADYLKLSDNLEEPQNLGFCIDILGPSWALNCSLPLHVHSCKPSSEEPRDMLFELDGNLVRSDRYSASCEYVSNTTENTGCVTVMDASMGDMPLGSVMMADCADLPTQQFVYNDTTEAIHLIANDTLCLSAGNESSAAGPVYVKRSLTMVPCGSNSILEAWSMWDPFEDVDGDDNTTRTDDGADAVDGDDVDVVDHVSYMGEPLPLTIYDGNGCDASNVVYTGSITDLFVMEQDVFCETGFVYMPNRTQTFHLKHEVVTCGSPAEGMPDAVYWNWYACTTEDCSDCDSEDLRLTHYTDWSYFTPPNPSVGMCLYYTNEHLVNDEVILDPRYREFVAGTNEEDIKAYWDLFLDNSCIADGPPGDTSSGTTMTGALVALGAAVSVASYYLY
jgi:hypothetical protein